MIVEHTKTAGQALRRIFEPHRRELALCRETDPEIFGSPGMSVGRGVGILGRVGQVRWVESYLFGGST